MALSHHQRGSISHHHQPIMKNKCDHLQHGLHHHHHTSSPWSIIHHSYHHHVHQPDQSPIGAPPSPRATSSWAPPIKCKGFQSHHPLTRDHQQQPGLQQRTSYITTTKSKGSTIQGTHPSMSAISTSSTYIDVTTARVTCKWQGFQHLLLASMTVYNLLLASMTIYNLVLASMPIYSQHCLS